MVHKVFSRIVNIESRKNFFAQWFIMVPMKNRLKVAVCPHKVHFAYKNIDNQNASSGDEMQSKIA